MNPPHQELESEARQALKELVEEGLPVSNWYFASSDYQPMGSGRPPECYVKFGTRVLPAYLPIQFPDQTASSLRGNIDEIKRQVINYLRDKEVRSLAK